MGNSEKLLVVELNNSVISAHIIWPQSDKASNVAIKAVKLAKISQKCIKNHR